MLVLTRKVGETLTLDGGIHITVIDIQGDHARIALNVPKEVKVHSEETYERLPEYCAPPYG